MKFLTKVDYSYEHLLEQCVEVNTNIIVVKILQGSVTVVHKPCLGAILQ